MSETQLREDLVAVQPFSWKAMSCKGLGTALLIVADYFVLFFALYIATQGRIALGELVPWLNSFALPFLNWTIAIPVVVIAFIFNEGMYTKRWPFAQGAQRIFRAMACSTMLLAGLLFLTHTYDVSRLFLLLFAVIGYVVLLLERYVLKRLLVKVGLWQKSVLLVGAGKTAALLAAAFEEDKGLGYHIVGVIEDSVEANPLVQKYPCLGGFADVSRAIVKCKPDEVLIAAPGIGRDKLLDLVYQVQLQAKQVTVAPDLYGMPLSNVEAETFFNQKLVLLKMTNNLARPWNKVIKRLFDLFGSIIGGILISPLLLVIALQIYRSDPGPIFFGHKRIGKNGKTFKCYKFRSMIVNAEEVLQEHLEAHPEAREEWAKDFKLKDDPRITLIGQFLRRTSLDELPQLFNVIRGEMSLVGPRPIVAEEIPKYDKFIQDFYLVRPGMTGFWQVSGRNDVEYEERVQMDSWYVRNWSLWLDCIMLLKTIGVVTEKKGAY